MYPHEGVAADGRCWMFVDELRAYRYEASIVALDVSGRLQTSMDGSPAGFEISRKFLSARVVQCGRAEYPRPYPTPDEPCVLEVRRSRACCSYEQRLSTVSSRPVPIGELEGSSCRAITILKPLGSDVGQGSVSATSAYSRVRRFSNASWPARRSHTKALSAH